MVLRGMNVTPGGLRDLSWAGVWGPPEGRSRSDLDPASGPASQAGGTAEEDKAPPRMRMGMAVASALVAMEPSLLHSPSEASAVASISGESASHRAIYAVCDMSAICLRYERALGRDFPSELVLMMQYM